MNQQAPLPTSPRKSGQSQVEVVSLSSEEALEQRKQVVEIYGACFHQPPYNEPQEVVDGFHQVFIRHAQRDGFHFHAAQDPGGNLLGFAYGYTSKPGQWWRDVVASELIHQYGEEQSNCWSDSAFELVELAVLPAARGKLLGSRLHDSLLAGLPHRAALLSTLQMETDALRLYRRRGWADLLENFWFPDTPKPYRIMGLDLTDPLHWLSGGDLRSTGRSVEAAAAVLARPEKFSRLVDGLSADDPRVRMRAADALEKSSAALPALLAPYRERLLDEAARAQQQEVRWHLAQILPRLPLNSKERSAAADILQTYFSDPSRIVQTFALQALVDLARQDPALLPLAAERLEWAAGSGIPSLESRAKKLSKYLIMTGKEPDQTAP